jgi:hypothetical protein
LAVGSGKGGGEKEEANYYTRREADGLKEEKHNIFNRDECLDIDFFEQRSRDIEDLVIPLGFRCGARKWSKYANISKWTHKEGHSPNQKC